jgi:hypothetical protein
MRVSSPLCARSGATDQLARFALAAIDGAVVAVQTDRGATLGRLLQPLVPSLVASRQAPLVKAGRPAGQAGE